MAAATKTSKSSAALRLMADPRRWELLEALTETDLRVNELVERVGAPQNLISYHLRELRQAGLVTSRRSSADGRDTYYAINPRECTDAIAAAARVLHPGAQLAFETRSARTGAKPRVLFLCTGNSARSQMAEALVRVRSNGSVEARSAGSAPKALHPNAVRVMRERGIDIADARAKHLDRFHRSRFDRVITLCDRVREICPDFPGQPVTAHWSIADPALQGDGAGSHAAFVRTADELETRIDVLLAQLSPPQEDNYGNSERSLSRR